MDFRLPDNTLFAILLRSRWWVSLLVAFIAFALVRLFLDDMVAIFAALPFLVIAAMSAWKQRRMPRGAKLEAAIARLRAMSWEEFASTLEEAYKREGFSVKRMQGGADFELVKEGRVLLVAAKRWKATRTGIEPLKELLAASEARGAADRLYVTAGELSDNAKKFADQSKIRLASTRDVVKLTAG